VFESVLSGSDVARAKPDPELFARSISNLGLYPAVCLVVEDAVAGVQAAQAAGASAVGIAAQPGSEEAAWLLDAGAVHVLAEVRELPEFLRQRGGRP
jgi:beta-phosphoglucomutase